MIAGLYKYNFLAPILVRSPWSRGAVETTCRCSRHLDTGRGGGGGGRAEVGDFRIHFQYQTALIS